MKEQSASTAPGVSLGLDISSEELATILQQVTGTRRPVYRYAQLDEGQGKWKTIPAAEADAWVTKTEPMFASLALTTYTEDMPEEPAYQIAPGLLWDIDRESLEESIEQTRKLVDKLVAYGVQQDALRLHASGKKGFHLELALDAVLQGGAPGLTADMMASLPKIMREFALATYVDGVDYQIYTGKRGRLIRQAGVRRGNGAYKVQITAAELRSLTPEGYAKLVAAPRPTFQVAPAPFCPELARVWSQAVDKGLAVAKGARGRKAKVRETLTEPQRERLLNALESIDPDCEHADWITVGMALQDELGDEGYSIWKDWSAGGAKYNLKTDATPAQWSGFSQNIQGGVTAASLFALAFQHGWEDPAPYLRPQREIAIDDGPTLQRLDAAAFAQYVATKHQHQLRRVFDLGAWAHWTGQHWSIGDDGPVWQIIGQERDYLLEQTKGAAIGAGQGEALMKFALKLTSAGFVKGVIDFLGREPELRTSMALFDTQGHLLNTTNGVVDLRTGERLPHDPEHLITLRANVAYDPMAQCPTWERVIREAMCDDEALIQYLHAALGYSCGGDTDLQQMFWPYGSGANSKSLILTTVAYILGSYAKTLNVQALMVQRGGSGAQPELVQIRGARFVRLSEPSRGQVLNLSTLKDIVSSEEMQIRGLHQGSFAWTPRCKLWAATNVLPTVTENTTGAWRRLRVIPFRAHFPEGKRDTTLADKLREEAPGILRWLVEGYKLAKRGVLESPVPAVAEATQEHRDQLNIVKRFLDECLVLDDPETTRPGSQDAGAVPGRLLYASYRQYCEAYGDRHMSNRLFGQDVSDYLTRSRTKAGAVYKGCRVKREWVPQDYSIDPKLLKAAIFDPVA